MEWSRDGGDESGTDSVQMATCPDGHRYVSRWHTSGTYLKRSTDSIGFMSGTGDALLSIEAGAVSAADNPLVLIDQDWIVYHGIRSLR